MEPTTEKDASIRRTTPEGLTREQILKYIDRRDLDMKAIHSAIMKQDARVIREISHKVKGNAALYGLEEFGTAAARVLASSERGDWTEIHRSVREMEERLRHAKEIYGR